MNSSTLHTACFDWHTAHGGRMVDFAGWEMPIQYSTIIEEHHAVRRAAGLFDIAHMGRIEFTGPDAGRFLDHLVTNDVPRLEVGQICYAFVTRQDGGILDDVLVYRLADRYLLVVNASNRPKILAWIEEHRASFDVQVEDLTTVQFMFALQGPRALEILQPLVDRNLAELRYYHGAPASFLNQPAFVSRTGYTGEDGFEVMFPAEQATSCWQAVIDAGQAAGLRPAGLAARDTLRLEAAMPLYGHELNESIDPFTAGLGFAVKLGAGDFIGRDALISLHARPQSRRRVGLDLSSRRIAREGAALYSGSESATVQAASKIGEVTSGTFSPTLERSIAMAYVEPQFAEPAQLLQVDIRGQREGARVVKLPFYKRSTTR